MPSSVITKRFSINKYDKKFSKKIKKFRGKTKNLFFTKYKLLYSKTNFIMDVVETIAIKI